MLNSIIDLTLLIAALAAGLMAGVYFAFSAFILRAFDQLGAVQAAATMNSVNEVILRSWFMVLFFGSTLLYAALAGYAVFAADLAGRWWLFAAGFVYLAGMFLCTALFNVPLNNRLAAAGVGDSTRVEAWKHYLVYWARWNHLRAICSLITAAISIQYLVSQA